MNSIIIILSMLFSSLFSFAEEAIDASRFTPDKAVTAFSKEDGFQLSDQALKNLGINFKAISSGDTWKISKGAIVHIKQSSGVYRRFEKWISFVIVKVVSQQGDSAVIKSEDLQAGDEVAMTGAMFLRLTDADLNAGTVDSCAH